MFIEQAMMDRDRKDELPKMQVGFIDAICTPVYEVSLVSFISGLMMVITVKLYINSLHSVLYLMMLNS